MAFSYDHQLVPMPLYENYNSDSQLSSVSPRSKTTPPKLTQSFTDDTKAVKFEVNDSNNSNYSLTQSSTTRTSRARTRTFSNASHKSHQSSKSFGRGRKLSNHVSDFEAQEFQSQNEVDWNGLIQMCPNLQMNNECNCAHMLKQHKRASRIWQGCYRINVSDINDNINDCEIAYFDGMYGKLCEYFKSGVDTDRIPQKSIISQALMHFGGFVIGYNDDIVIDRCHFLLFWKWYQGITEIVKDLHNLWDLHCPFKMDLFIDRQTSQNILSKAPIGTFLLRLSQSQTNGLVLSYSESTAQRKVTVRHLLLARHSHYNYTTKTNHNSTKEANLSNLIRNFVKLKYVYTPQQIYQKMHVF